MPVYTFRCSKCGQQYEALVRKFGATAPCPACGDQRPDKLLSLLASLLGRGKSGASGGRCAPRRRSGFG